MNFCVSEEKRKTKAFQENTGKMKENGMKILISCDVSQDASCSSYICSVRQYRVFSLCITSHQCSPLSLCCHNIAHNVTLSSQIWQHVHKNQEIQEKKVKKGIFGESGKKGKIRKVFLILKKEFLSSLFRIDKKDRGPQPQGTRPHDRFPWCRRVGVSGGWEAG